MLNADHTTPAPGGDTEVRDRVIREIDSVLLNDEGGTYALDDPLLSAGLSSLLVTALDGIATSVQRSDRFTVSATARAPAPCESLSPRGRPEPR